jgi:Fatty acid hydroxylase superfamily
MRLPKGVSPDAVARARANMRKNAQTAILCGCIPAAILGLWFPAKPQNYLIGFLLGALWANCFEYLYHRFLLHRPRSVFGLRHSRHHADTQGEAAADVNFGTSPAGVFHLFALHAAPVVVLDRVFRLGFAPGVLIAFAVYFVVAEEIHWRVHLGGWLPPGLRYARAYHLAHHDRPNGRYNVFLPIFDWLLSTAGDSSSVSHSGVTS